VRREGNSRSVALAFLVAVAILGCAVPSAGADRRPSKAEARAIKRVALKACGSPDCEFGRGRVSTRNARFAWADVVAEGFSGVLLKRPRVHSRRFRVVGFQGGGIGSCTYWRARAPAAVLRDLDISGVIDDSGTTRNCGKI
jgi:hypothetical protein